MIVLCSSSVVDKQPARNFYKHGKSNNNNNNIIIIIINNNETIYYGKVTWLELL